jgi:hypothetical protein
MIGTCCSRETSGLNVHLIEPNATFSESAPLAPLLRRLDFSHSTSCDSAAVVSRVFRTLNWAERRPALAQAVGPSHLLVRWSFSSSMFKYLLLDHAVPAMCRSLAAAKLRADCSSVNAHTTRVRRLISRMSAGAVAQPVADREMPGVRSRQISRSRPLPLVSRRRSPNPTEYIVGVSPYIVRYMWHYISACTERSSPA